jgi:uncharacterized membrane protein YphA (DoxX/SURF4 family)
MAYSLVGIRCLLVVVFVAAVVGKVRDRRSFTAFRASIRDILPAFAVAAEGMAAAVVAAEVGVCVLLLLPTKHPWGCALAGVLLTGFCAVITAALARGTVATCACFGASVTRLSLRHLVRNGLLALAAVAGATMPAPRHLSAPGIALAALAGLTAGAIVVRLDDIIALFTRLDDASDRMDGNGVPWRS